MYYQKSSIIYAEFRHFRKKRREFRSISGFKTILKIYMLEYISTSHDNANKKIPLNATEKKINNR